MGKRKAFDINTHIDVNHPNATKKSIKKDLKKLSKQIENFKDSRIGVGSGLGLGIGHPHYKIADDEIVVRGKKNKDGSITLSKKEIEKVNKIKLVSREIECVACDGEGVVGADYCEACAGSGSVVQRQRVVIGSKEEKEAKKEKDLKAGYPSWTKYSDIKKGTALSWDDLDDMC